MVVAYIKMMDQKEDKKEKTQSVLYLSALEKYGPTKLMDNPEAQIISPGPRIYQIIILGQFALKSLISLLEQIKPSTKYTKSGTYLACVHQVYICSLVFGMFLVFSNILYFYRVNTQNCTTINKSIYNYHIINF